MSIATMTKLPEPKEVRDLLVDLLDRPVDLVQVAPYTPEPGERCTYCVYVDDRLSIRAIAVADLPFTAYAAGAIGLMPAHTVQEHVEAKQLPETVEENFYEVVNICASLMNAENMPHIKLHAVHGTAELAPPHVLAMSTIVGRRLDLDLTVGGYGRGRFSLVVIA
jgi:hypothetical protein